MFQCVSGGGGEGGRGDTSNNPTEPHLEPLLLYISIPSNIFGMAYMKIDENR